MMASRRTIIAATLALMALTGAGLIAMGRSAICACGHVALFHGALDAGNSQHLLDWYSPSHLIHGLLLYGLGWLVLRRVSIGGRFLLAVTIEAAWELIENSPLVIDRYRTATIALGYTGDSVVNSLMDISCMMVGFALARRLPVLASLLLAIMLELLTLILIRDHLTLNILMLLWPIDAVRIWQGQ